MRLLLSAILLAKAIPSLAQHNTVGTGGEATGAGGSMSYSVGQVDAQFQSSAQGTVAQGLQQPYEFLVMAVPVTPEASFTTTLLPNPTTEAVTLRLAGTPTDPVRWELYDVNGRLLGSALLTGTETRIPLEHTATGEYLLHVVQAGTPISITKVIKH